MIRNKALVLICPAQVFIRYHVSNKFEEFVNRIPRARDSKCRANITKSFDYKMPWIRILFYKLGLIIENQLKLIHLVNKNTNYPATSLCLY